MHPNPYLTEAEFASLTEVGTGFCHDQISIEHAAHLLDLRLIYSLLGNLRITTAGQLMLHAGHQIHH
jgi:hypothetical protein